MPDIINRRSTLAGAAVLLAAAWLPKQANAAEQAQPDPALAAVEAYWKADAAFEQAGAEDDAGKEWPEGFDWNTHYYMPRAAAGNALEHVSPTPVAGLVALAKAALHYEMDWNDQSPVTVALVVKLVDMVQRLEATNG